MNPLWGLKLNKINLAKLSLRSQKHESSLGIETGFQAGCGQHKSQVPKSMNPLWGLKRTIASLIYL